MSNLNEVKPDNPGHYVNNAQLEIDGNLYRVPRFSVTQRVVPVFVAYETMSDPTKSSEERCNAAREMLVSGLSMWYSSERVNTLLDQGHLSLDIAINYADQFIPAPKED